MAEVGITLSLSPKSLATLYGMDIPCTSSHACPWDLLYFPYGWYYEPTYEVPTGSALISAGAPSNAGSYRSSKVGAYLREIDAGVGGLTTFYKYENYVAQQLPLLWMPEIVNQISAVTDKLSGWSPQQAQLDITPETWRFHG